MANLYIQPNKMIELLESSESENEENEEILVDKINLIDPLSDDVIFKKPVNKPTKNIMEPIKNEIVKNEIVKNEEIQKLIIKPAEEPIVKIIKKRKKRILTESHKKALELGRLKGLEKRRLKRMEKKLNKPVKIIEERLEIAQKKEKIKFTKPNPDADFIKFFNNMSRYEKIKLSRMNKKIINKPKIIIKPKVVEEINPYLKYFT